MQMASKVNGKMNKVLQFPLVRIILAVVFVGVGLVVAQTALNILRAVFSITDTRWANLLAFVLVAPATYFAYVLYVRLIEKRSPTELSGTKALSEFGVGAAVGFALFALAIALLWLLGYYRVTAVNADGLAVIGALAGALVSALAQELIFRAVIYRITEEWLGTGWALAISAILFGLIHLTNSGATIVSALAVALQAGILLGAAYALTHRLWLALGLHMAWDFANDGIFGVGVAGQSGQSLRGLLQANLSGPALFTGGALGVEASLIALAVTLLAGSLLLWMAYNRGKFVSRAK